jgi:hypothetical protein
MGEVVAVGTGASMVRSDDRNLLRKRCARPADVSTTLGRRDSRLFKGD